MFNTMQEVKIANIESGSHFFDKDTLKFFNSKIESLLVDNRYFITSESQNGDDKKYSIRYARDDGSIDTIGDFQEYETFASAWGSLNNLSRRNPSKVPLYKQIKSLLDDVKDFDFDVGERREFIESLDESDFIVGDYRFIDKDAIDGIQQDELSGDTYMLGCFNSWFIADILDIDEEVVIAAQNNEAYEGLGASMTAHIDEVQQNYASQDGYGHHFNHYDGCEYDISSHYAFQVN